MGLRVGQSDRVERLAEDGDLGARRGFTRVDGAGLAEVESPSRHSTRPATETQGVAGVGRVPAPNASSVIIDTRPGPGPRVAGHVKPTALTPGNPPTRAAMFRARVGSPSSQRRLSSRSKTRGVGRPMANTVTPCTLYPRSASSHPEQTARLHGRDDRARAQRDLRDDDGMPQPTADGATLSAPAAERVKDVHAAGLTRRREPGQKARNEADSGGEQEHAHVNRRLERVTRRSVRAKHAHEDLRQTEAERAARRRQQYHAFRQELSCDSTRAGAQRPPHRNFTGAGTPAGQGAIR